jgi:signal transduction histidine kinase
MSEILYDNIDLEANDRQSFLDIIIKETERMSRLITQVLDLEKLERGNEQLQLSVIPIDEIIEQVQSTMMPLIAQKNIEYSAYLLPNTPILVSIKIK